MADTVPAEDDARARLRETAEAFSGFTVDMDRLTEDHELGLAADVVGAWGQCRNVADGLVDTSLVVHLETLKDIPALVCPSCGAKLRGWAEHAGEAGLCSHCKAMIQTPPLPGAAGAYPVAVDVREASREWIRSLQAGDHAAAREAMSTIRGGVHEVLAMLPIDTATHSAAAPAPTSVPPKVEVLDAQGDRWTLNGKPLIRNRAEAGAGQSEIRVFWGGKRLSKQSQWLLAMSRRSQGEDVKLPQIDTTRLLAALRDAGAEIEPGPRFAGRVELGAAAKTLVGMPANRP